MYLGKSSIFLLLHLSFVSSGKSCQKRSKINLLEEEYFSVCCSTTKEDGYTAHWFREKEGKLVPIEEDSRIDLNGTYLQFWPAVLNDTGKYSCSLSNGTHNVRRYEWALRVLRRNKTSCFTKNHIENGIHGETGKSYTFSCNNMHQSEHVNITWYKDCIMIQNEMDDDLYIPQLKLEDAGKYTCVKSFIHVGKIYNSTRTIELKLKDRHDSIGARLIGRELRTLKTTVGKNETLNCTAFFPNNSFENHFLIYWLYNETHINNCQDSSASDTQCEKNETTINREDGKYVTKQLWIKSVKEENINSAYSCIFNGRKNINQTFILEKEINPDLPFHVFTTGIIMAILFPFVGVFVVVLCVVFRVDLVLLYRDITGKDDTLGDGKLYDAFVSYLKDSMPLCGDERKFALDVLPKILEEHFGYKLCIFERDICPGGAVVDDVHSFIEKSRRLIIILTKNYVSDSVMFELETGLHKALVEKKINVILIEYMPANDLDFLPKSLKLLSSSQMVKWKEKKSLPLNSSFWKKLRYAMPAKPSSTNVTATFQEQCPRIEDQHVAQSVSHPSCPH
ncbi:interleukin-18 receptor 1 [Varanus komodoensis]|uniref:Interleukin 18 receptor 1 n=1 Tax=Varanus komodoensis TaxID=61221 RepID=A0A8D2JIA9_VARKO|nr:interleukin-18 receptor 1 [Varanus komodoensis]